MKTSFACQDVITAQWRLSEASWITCSLFNIAFGIEAEQRSGDGCYLYTQSLDFA